MYLTSTAAVRNTPHSQAKALQTAEQLQDYMFFTCEYVPKKWKKLDLEFLFIWRLSSSLQFRKKQFMHVF